LKIGNWQSWKYFKKISPEDVKTLMGDLEVSQIVPQPKRLLVIDIHGRVLSL